MCDHRRKLVKISGGARGARIIGGGKGQRLGGHHGECGARAYNWGLGQKWISDATYAAISEKREAKGKDKKRYQELKAEVQRKLRVDKQQQLEGTCMELHAANSKGNSRKLFQIVKSMTKKFRPRLQGIQSATGENLTEAAQIANRWKGYCEDLYCDEEGKGIEQEYWEQEPPPLR